VVLLMLTGCGAPEGESVVLQLQLNADPGEAPAFNITWRDARAQPQLALAYAFPARSRELAGGTPVELVVARYTGLYDGLGRIVVQEPFRVMTSPLGEDGGVRFQPLSVASGATSSDSGEIPASYLCGETVILVRAGDEAGYRAEDHYLAVTEACD